MKQITDAIVQILKDWSLTRGVKVQALSSFDIEYLFLNIRAKSVGETVEVNVTCPDDGDTKVQIEIAVPDDKVDSVITAIQTSANTDKIGDGKIFVLPIEQAIRIRTGESGDSAV